MRILRVRAPNGSRRSPEYDRRHPVAAECATCPRHNRAHGPVTLGVEIAEKKLVVQTKLDCGYGAGDLAGDESLGTGSGLSPKIWSYSLGQTGTAWRLL